MWVIAFALTGMLAYAGISRSLGGKEIIPWRDDFAVAQAEAKQTGKPMLLYFTADWCGPCQSMKRTTWADANVDQALQQYVPTRIDIDRNAELAMEYRIESIPQMLVIGEDGAISKRFSKGAVNAADFLEWLAAPVR